MFKVGIGYDIHRLVPKRKLVLGGIRIKHAKGLLGHSDADVLLHAICDALLGAVGVPDIGHQFPDADVKYKNISSLKLLKKVEAIISKKGYCADHVDAMILCEAPRISKYREKMKARISKVLKIKKDQVSIKATTHEGVGAIGRQEAIAAMAVCLIQMRRPS
jgi:2-C-methyl-D-erythritol 2,4-cyclodiphosphate synthase